PPLPTAPLFPYTTLFRSRCRWRRFRSMAGSNFHNGAAPPPDRSGLHDQGAHVFGEGPQGSYNSCRKALMKHNVGRTEKIIRVSVGAAAVAAAIFAPLRPRWRGLLGAVAADGILTGVIGYSPLKRVFGISR